MTLDRLEIELAVTEGNVKKEIKAIEKLVKKAAKTVEEYEQQVKDLEDIGFKPGNEYWQEAVDDYNDATEALHEYWQELEEAVAKEKAEKAAIQEANQARKDAAKAAREAAKAEKEASKNPYTGSQLMNIGRVALAWRMLKKLVDETAEAVRDYSRDNPTSSIAKDVQRLEKANKAFRENWAKANERNVEIIANIAGALTGVTEEMDKIKIDSSEWDFHLKAVLNSTKILRKYTGDTKIVVKQLKNLISSFDELNVLNRASDEEEALSVEEKREEVLEDIASIQDEIKDLTEQQNKIWDQWADKLGLNREQFQAIFDAWQKYTQGKLSWEEFSTFVKQYTSLDPGVIQTIMAQFATDNNGWPAIQTLDDQINQAKRDLTELLRLAREAGLIDNKEERSNDPSPSANENFYGAQGRHSGTANAGKLQDDKLKSSYVEQNGQQYYKNLGISASEFAGLASTYKSGGNWKTQWDSIWGDNTKNKPGEWSAELAIRSYLKSVNLLANGGVFKAPALGMVGEYSGASSNPEIVAPQSMMYDTVVAANGQLASVMAQGFSQVVGAVNAQNLEVKIGDDVIAQSAARGNQNYKRMTGQSLI